MRKVRAQPMIRPRKIMVLPIIDQEDRVMSILLN